MPTESYLERTNPSEHKRIPDKTYYISKTCYENKTIPSLYIILAVFILSYTIFLPAAASSLSLFAPSEVDVSGEGVYEMNFISSDDARSLSALLPVPDGFSYPGNANIIWQGTKSSCEPYLSGQSLLWDISSAIKSNRRHNLEF